MRVREVGSQRILIALLAMSMTHLACSQTMPVAPKAFPDTDLIFQTNMLREDGGHEGLGFVNADGSSLSFLTVLIPNAWGGKTPPVLPVVTNDGSMVVFRIESDAYRAGDLVIWQVGQPAQVCNVDLGGYRPALTVGDTQAVIDLTGPRGRLMILDLLDCQDSSAPLAGGILTLAAPDTQTDGALRPDGDLLAYAKWDPDLGSDVIIVRRLSDGKETSLGQGITPAWSPDGQWIAYTWVDGIYAADPQGNGIRRIVDYTSPGGGGHPLFRDRWPPLPSWSPDGQWLVYHKCVLPPAPKTHCGEEIEDYAIFKVNVETGEEIKILDGGLNPYWRGRPAQP